MCNVKHISRISQKLGSLLSTLFLVFTLVLSPFTVAEAHDTPHKIFTVAVAAQTHVPASCHSNVSCTVYVVPSQVSQLTAGGLYNQRFWWSEAVFLVTYNPTIDTPPPRV